MATEDQLTALLSDLAQLYEGGSGVKVLVGCRTIASLGPVLTAVRAGERQVPSLRLFLEFVAKRTDTLDARVGAALVGIAPSSTGRGVRDEPGKGERATNAGEIAGGRASKTIVRKLDTYLAAYAEAVVTLADRCQREPELLREFLRLCSVSEENIARLTTDRTPADQPATITRLDVSLPSLARSVPLAGALRAALDAARSSCAARGRAFYTSDLLLALIELPGGRAASYLDNARAGAATEVGGWLHRSLAGLGTGNAHPHRPFEWIERPDIRLAQDLAFADGTGIVTELHLLLAVLDGDSATAKGLARLLDVDFAAVRVAVDQARLTLPEVLLTPGPAPELLVTEEPT